MPTDVVTGEALANTLGAVRERTLALVAHLSDEDLERVLDPLMSPLVWDLGHIAAYEDLWLAHRFGGLELLRPDLAAFYDAFETPRAVRGDLEILGHADARAYLDAVRERVLGVAERDDTGDGTIFELVLRHELQHTETMRQAMALGGLLPPGEPPSAPPADDGDAWAAVPGGGFMLGARDGAGFSYDNERPAHRVELASFRIARRPVSNASWLSFAEGGGYERREWWSDEGWSWKQCYDITDCPGAREGHPGAPVCHVSWFE